MGAASCTQRCSGEERESESIRNLEVQSHLIHSESGPADTVTKLTAQLEVFETQLRQVQEENDNLSRLKESLERLVENAAKQNDQLKEQLQSLELQLSSEDKDHSGQISSLKAAVQDLKDKLQSADSSVQQSSKADEYSAQLSSLEAAVQDLNGKLQSADSAALAENEKWSLEKKSLERAAAAAASEREQLKEQLKKIELQLARKENEYSAQISRLAATVEDLNGKLESATTTARVENEKFAQQKGYLEQVAATASSERDQLEKNLHNLSSERDQLKNKLHNLSSGKDQLEQKLQNLSSEREQLVKKLHNLELKVQEQSKPQNTAKPTPTVVKKVYICSFCKRFETEGVPELKQHMVLCAQRYDQIMSTNLGYGGGSGIFLM